MSAWDTPIRGRTPRQRFEIKYVEREDGCWEWQASRTEDGYGMFWLEGRMWGAHRISYEMNVGPIPDGQEIDHLCRNRACVNPDHLEPVAKTENVLRGVGPTSVNAAKTQCINGHDFTDANTMRHDNGGRRCRTCHNARTLAGYHRRKEQAS